jgi:hypothetical membrane protein
MTTTNKAFYLLCLGIFVAIILILPSFSFEGYSITLNSISQLGGQWHPYAWVMNIFGFMLMGLAVVQLYTKIPLVTLSKILVMTFGFAMIAVGFFQHEPVAGYGVTNVFEANMHSIIANVMGIAITLFAVSLIFDKKVSKNYRLIAFMAAAVSSLLSLLMVTFPDYYGLIQRIMFILILSWLLYVARIKSKVLAKQIDA